MKTPNNQSKEQESISPRNEPVKSSSGGTAAFEDNRSGAMLQRKLREGFADSSRNEDTAQLRQSMEESNSGSPIPIQRKSNQTGLPDNLKSGIENLSGFAMDDVKVHYNSSKPAQLQAHAYAQGTHIHLAPGQEKHLGHEAWHVVQQKQGRVKPTRQHKSKVSINDDAGLEKEADVMGAKALRVAGNGLESVAQRQASNPGKNADISPSARMDENDTVQMWGIFSRFFKKKRAPAPVAATVAAPVAAPAVDPALAAAIRKIENVNLRNLASTIIQNSRAKTIYLFDANGDHTTDKNTAAFMVDTAMDSSEQANYAMVKSWGVGVPEIYGKNGTYPIVQWIPNHITVGGGGRNNLVSSVKQSMFLDGIQKRGFAMARWTKLLEEVDGLLAMGYSSDDLQFMVEENSGEIYIMDLEGNNKPRKDAGEDPILVDLKELLEEKIKEQEADADV
jgi:hypothetical protein